MNKPYRLIHVTKERSLSMLVDVCQCGHTHDSHKYLDIFYFRVLLGTNCYWCKCSKYIFQTKMTLRDAVDNFNKRPFRHGVNQDV